MSETNRDSFAHCELLPAGNVNDRFAGASNRPHGQKIALGGVGLSITLLSSVYMQGRNLSRHVRQIIRRDPARGGIESVCRGLQLTQDLRYPVPGPENPGLRGREGTSMTPFYKNS